MTVLAALPLLLVATYYSGAYYLGEYRGGQHTWHNFAASGALAGLAVSTWLIRPWRSRPAVMGVVLGSLLGSASALTLEAYGQPHWDLSRDFQGYWLGSFINKKKERRLAERERRMRAEVVAEGGSGQGGGGRGATGSST